MSIIIQVDTISKINQLKAVETTHPLISVYDSSISSPLPKGNYHFGLYGIFLKELHCGVIKYGRKNYDYQEGTMVYIAPGQVIGVEEQENYVLKGWTMFFHPDLIKGTPLGREMHKYNFFSYDSDEALHVSEKERAIMIDQFKKIKFELDQSIDRHSKKILASSIELLLNYSQRFYDRQFITRDNENAHAMEKFDRLLRAYFQSQKPMEEGIPTVAAIAKQLHLSANYLGDLIKKETGIAPLEHIQNRLIDLSKDKILDLNKSIAQVSAELGFKYPQHFTRLFKQKVGIAPNEYRNLN